MKITICGSIAFFDEMLKAKKELEDMGHEVDLPPTEIKNGEGKMIPVAEYYRIRKSENPDAWVWDAKKVAMLTHFKKEEWADVILVLNIEKNGVAGYVGANTLIEMGLALFLDKPIYLLNDIPEISSKEEIVGMQPIVINGDLTKIK
ncbi:MAG: hypothetical protein WCI36_05450 [bacterium]